jgi:predicted transcriptional regulator
MKLGLTSNEHQFYIRVLEIAQETGSLTQKMINEKLLFRNADHVMGKRILEILEKLDLIQGKERFSYDISNKGRIARSTYYHVNRSSEDIHLLKLLENTGLLKINGNKGSKYYFEKTKEGDDFFNSKWPRVAKSDEEESILETFSLYDLFVKIGAKKVRQSPTVIYKLTDTGKYILDSGIVRIPEEGYFIIHTTEDPLVPERIIGYDRPKSNSSREFQEVRGKGIDEKGKHESKIASPKWVTDLQKELQQKPKNIKLVAQNYEDIQIYEIGDELSISKAKLNPSITLNVPLYGNLELILNIPKSQNKDFIVQHTLNLGYHEILADILKGSNSDIMFLSDEPTFLATYSDLKPIEKITFRKKIEIKKPAISGYGEFDDVYLNMLITPKIVEDAVLWINWLVEEQVDHYVDEKEYLKIINKCVDSFKERFEPEMIIQMLSTFEDFMHNIADHRHENPRKYWYVTTPQILTIRR